eukprot:c23143_g1_i1 orf=224-1183(+)
MSTVKVPEDSPDVQQDCMQLRKALHGSLICDERKVVEILAHRDYLQRREICEIYKNLYAEELLDLLGSKLHHKLKRAIRLWMEDAAVRDAKIIKAAFTSWGTANRAALEVFCTRTSSELQAIMRAYNLRYGHSLEKDIMSYTTGNYRKLLLSYLSEIRPEGVQVDMLLAQADAEDLYKAGEFRSGGINEAALIRILSTRNTAQLNAAFDVYKLRYGHDIEKVMKKNSSGDFDVALRAIIKCIHQPAKYFAKVLYKSMKGLGTDDPTLTRVVVTHAEVDMQDIKDEFVRKYKRSLESMISFDTLGNYKSFLLILIGSHHY